MFGRVWCQMNPLCKPCPEAQDCEYKHKPVNGGTMCPYADNFASQDETKPSWRETLVDPQQQGRIPGNGLTTNTVLEHLAYHNRNIPKGGPIDLGELEWCMILDCRMTDRQRNILYRRYWEGLSVQQIATQDKRNVHTIKRTLARAETHLATHLRRAINN